MFSKLFSLVFRLFGMVELFIYFILPEGRVESLLFAVLFLLIAHDFDSVVDKE